MNPMPFAQRRERFQGLMNSLSGRYEMFDHLLAYRVSGERQVGQWLTIHTKRYFGPGNAPLATRVKDQSFVLPEGPGP